MPLSRLENFIKNVEGNILYVNPSDLDATDSIENQGNSLTRPFKTIQRALIEAARFSYQIGPDNDKFDKTTILVYPGVHKIDNRPGYSIHKNGDNATYKNRNGTTVSFGELTGTSNFDIEDNENVLHIFNSVNGGVIIPRGTSLVGMDLRKTKIYPLFVPDPENTEIDRTAIFKITGGCYFWQFSLFDGDPNGQVYKNYTPSRFTPNFSHHKLTCFEYADGKNAIELTAPTGGSDVTSNLTDLDAYYFKIANAYGNSSGRPIANWPTSNDIEPKLAENQIVGAIQSDPIGITSVFSTSNSDYTFSGAVGRNIVVTTSVEHNLAVGTPIILSGITTSSTAINDDEIFNAQGGTIVSHVLSPKQFAFVASENAPITNPHLSGDEVVQVEPDTVTGASPYIFNCSLRSVYGVNGLHADGSKATGFKSMVLAQFTGIGLQKDDNAFLFYDETTGTYKDNTNVDQEQKPLHINSKCVYKPSYESCHVKVSNSAILQCVSIFAIGFANHFVAESGGDQSITNSNSNFGAKALIARGFRDLSFNRDDSGYITHIIPPKETSPIEENSFWVPLNVGLSTSYSGISSDRLYAFGYTDIDSPPTHIIDSYRIGSKKNDLIKLELFGQTKTANILMQGSSTATNEKVIKVTKTGAGNSITESTGSVFGLDGNHEFEDGETVRVLSDTGRYPDGLSGETVYYVIKTGVNPNQIKLAKTFNQAISGSALSGINNKGGKLSIVSRVSDKLPGESGHPIQWDSTNNNWYIGVEPGTSNTIWPELFNLTKNVTGKTFISRKPDGRNLDDRIYKIRYVIPKEFTNAKPPSAGYIIQESKNTIVANSAEYSSTIQNLTDFRNVRIIHDIDYDSNAGLATVTSEKPHGLILGSRVKINNIKSTNNSTGVGNSGFNGNFDVQSINDSKSFVVNIPSTKSPGTYIPIRPASITDRDENQPNYSINRFSNTFYIYRINTIKEYVSGKQDGIYYLTCLVGSISPSSGEFSDRKFSQNVVNLYPQLDRDNYNSDPKSAISIAENYPISKVTTDDLRNSITREFVDKFILDNRFGFKITNAEYDSSIGIATFTTDIQHGLNNIINVSIADSGSGFGYSSLVGVAGTTIYNGKLTGGSGEGATITFTVDNDSNFGVISPTIVDGGSGYQIGDTLTLSRVGIPTFSDILNGIDYTNASFTITGINKAVNNSLKISNVLDYGVKTDEFNGVKRITGVPSSKKVEVLLGRNNSSIGTYKESDDGLFSFAGKGSKITSIEYTDIQTGIVTVTCDLAHGLNLGNKFVLDYKETSSSSDSDYSGTYVVLERVGIKTFTFFIGQNVPIPSTPITTGYVLPAGYDSQSADSDESQENIERRMVPFNVGISTTLNGQLTNNSSSITLTNSDGFEKGDYLQVGSEIVRITTNFAANSASIIRGLFGTRRSSIESGTLVKKIKPIPCENRRYSILRASGHTFEYVGFGPGNYSNSLPQRQDRNLTKQEQLLTQSEKTDGGVVVYTGMNDSGDFYVGNRRLSSATGQEETIGIPIPTFVGDDSSGTRLSVVFDDVTVKENIKVEGGASNIIQSEFNGPVLFTNKIVSNSDQGADFKFITLKGTKTDDPATTQRKITVGISTPAAAADNSIGDIVFRNNPEPGGYLGWVFAGNQGTEDTAWRKFGLIATENAEEDLGSDSNTNSPLGNFTILPSKIGINTNIPSSVFEIVDGTAKLDQLTVAGLATFYAPVTLASLEVADALITNKLESRGLVSFGAINGFNVSGNTVISGLTTITGDTDLNGRLDLSSNVSVGSAAFIKDTLDVCGNTTLNRELTVSGNADLNSRLDVSGNTSLGGRLDVTGAISGSSTLDIEGNTSLGGTLGVSGATNIRNTLTVSGNTDLNRNLNVSGNTSLGGRLDVTGAISGSSTLDIEGNTSLGGTLSVSGNTDLNSRLDVSGNTSLGGRLDVTGAISGSSTLDIEGNTSLGGTLGVSGATNIRNTLTVSGNTDLNSRLDVAGNTCLGGTLTVKGFTSFDGDITVCGNTLYTGSLNVSSNTSVGGRLDVTGAISGSSTLDIEGNTSLGGTLSVSGNTDLNSRLDVSGNTSLGGNLTITGNTSLDGTLNVSGATNIKNTLTLSGNADFNRNLDVSGNTNLQGTLTVSGNADLNRNLDVSGNTSIGGNVDIAGTLCTDGATVHKSLVDVRQTTSTNVVEGMRFVLQRNLADHLFHLAPIYSSSPGTICQQLDRSIRYNFTNNEWIIKSPLNVSGSVSIKKDLIVEDNTDLNSRLDVAGNTCLGGTLTVKGFTSFDDDITVCGNTLYTGSLSVSGTASIGGTLDVTGNTSIGGTLYVNSTTILNGEIEINSKLNANNISSSGLIRADSTICAGTGLHANANLHVAGTACIGGVTQLKSNVSVGGNLRVAGGTCLNGGATIKNGLTVYNPTDIKGTLYVSSTTTLNGETTINNKLNTNNISSSGLIRADSTICAGTGLHANANLHVAGTACIGGVTQLKSGVSVGSNLHVAGTACIGGNVQLKSNVSVGGNVDIAGTLCTDGATVHKSLVDVRQTTSTNVVEGMRFVLQRNIADHLFHLAPIYGSATPEQQLGRSIRYNFTNNKWIIKSPLDVSGNTFVNGNFRTNGTTSLDGDAIVRGNLRTIGTTSLDGDAIVSGNLKTKGTTCLNGGAIIRNGLTVYNPTDIKGTLTVSSTTTLNGETTINSKLNANDISSSGLIRADGNICAGTDLHANANLHVAGTACIGGVTQLKSNVSVGGNVDIAGTLTAGYISATSLTTSGVITVQNVANQALFKNSGTNRTVIHRNDGSNYYILLSDDYANTCGTWNGLRPFYINNATGKLNSKNGQKFTGGTNICDGATIRNGLTAYGPTDIKGTLYVSSTTTLNGETTINNKLNTNNISSSGSLIVDNGVCVGGILHVDRNLHVSGTTCIGGNVQLKSNVSVGGRLDVAGSICIGGNVQLKSNVSVGSNLHVAGTACIGGNVQLKSGVSVGGRLDVDGPVCINGITTLKSIVDVKDTTSTNVLEGMRFVLQRNTAQHIFHLAPIYSSTPGTTCQQLDSSLRYNYSNNNWEVKVPLSVSGNTFVNGNFRTNGTTSLDGDAIVSGNLRTKGTTCLNGGATIRNGLTVHNPTDIKGTLYVSSTTTLNGETTINNKLNTNNISSSGLIRADSTICAGTGLHANANLHVAGTACIGGNVQLKSGVSVGGRLDVDGPVCINGITTLKSIVDVKDTTSTNVLEGMRFVLQRNTAQHIFHLAPIYSSTPGTTCQQLDSSLRYNYSNNNWEVKVPLSVSGNTFVNGNFRTNGTTSLDGDAIVSGKLRTKGTTCLDGGATIRNGLTVYSGTTQKGVLNVSGKTTLNNLQTKGTTCLDGGATIRNGLTVYNPTDIKGTLYVSSTTTLNGETTINNKLNTNNISSSGSLIVDNGVCVGGILHVDRNLHVSGTTCIGGVTQLKSNVSVGGRLDVDGTVCIDGITTHKSRVDVQQTTSTGVIEGMRFILQKNTAQHVFHLAPIYGSATPEQQLDSSLRYNYSNNNWEVKVPLSVSGNTFVNGNFRTNGTTSLDGGAAIRNGLTVYNGTTQKGFLTVSGNTVFNGVTYGGLFAAVSISGNTVKQSKNVRTVDFGADYIIIRLNTAGTNRDKMIWSGIARATGANAEGAYVVGPNGRGRGYGKGEAAFAIYGSAGTSPIPKNKWQHINITCHHI